MYEHCSQSFFVFFYLILTSSSKSPIGSLVVMLERHCGGYMGIIFSDLLLSLRPSLFGQCIPLHQTFLISSINTLSCCTAITLQECGGRRRGLWVKLLFGDYNAASKTKKCWVSGHCQRSLPWLLNCCCDVNWGSCAILVSKFRESALHKWSWRVDCHTPTSCGSLVFLHWSLCHCESYGLWQHNLRRNLNIIILFELNL